MNHQESILLQCLSENSQARDLGLYIHIPFCRKRCHFCAFYLTTYREGQVQGFLAALAKEISLYAIQGTCDRLPISTMYFGGGTPTSLQSEHLKEIIALIKQHFTVSSSAEITVEADPDSVSRLSLQVLQDAGVNRLSFGVQSLEQSEWSRLGRSGKMDMVWRAMREAKDIGFSNVSIDLIYGLPGQTLQTWQDSLEQVVELQPHHVSCYALTIEEGTRFHRDRDRGMLAGNDLELETAMHEKAVTYLQRVGYRQYEVSNFAREGFECQHNLRYWSGLDYLGLGPSAQSYVSGIRFGNIADLSTYSSTLERQQLPVESFDRLSRDEAARERVIFGLRMNQGVPTQALQPFEKDEHWQATVERMINSGLLLLDSHHLKVTAMGRQFIDTVSLKLL